MDGRLIKQINDNFLIRTRWPELSKSSRLVGAGQYAQRIGNEELAEKHFKRVLRSQGDKHTFKLRRGLRIDFYVR